MQIQFLTVEQHGRVKLVCLKWPSKGGGFPPAAAARGRGCKCQRGLERRDALEVWLLFGKQGSLIYNAGERWTGRVWLPKHEASFNDEIFVCFEGLSFISPGHSLSSATFAF